MEYGLFLLFVASLVALIKPHCGHACTLCAQEQKEKREQQRINFEQTDHMWHVKPVDSCTLCRKDK